MERGPQGGNRFFLTSPWHKIVSYGMFSESTGNGNEAVVIQIGFLFRTRKNKQINQQNFSVVCDLFNHRNDAND